MVDVGRGDDPGDDAALVVAVSRGDQEAIAAIFDRYAPRVHAFCTRILGDPHTAADATQDTFITAARRLDQLRDPTKLRPWLYAVARNECTRHGRARDRAVPVEDAAMTSDGVAGNDDAPAREAQAGEVAELLWAAAAGLDERDRTLLELHVRHGLDGGDLALAAGIAPGQISMATGRMRGRLERAIGALLVARRGRSDCPALQVVLADWDGTFSVLVRKRVARHVDGCELCDERRQALVAPLGSLAVGPMLLPFAATGLPSGLRERVLEAVGPGASGGGDRTGDGWRPDGFPVVPSLADDDLDAQTVVDLREEGRARRLARRGIVVPLLALVVLIGGLAWWAAADDGATTSTASGSSSTDERVVLGAGSSTSTGPSGREVTTTEGGAVAPASTSLPAGGPPATADPSIAVPGPTTTVAPTLPPVVPTTVPPSIAFPSPTDAPPSVGAPAPSAGGALQTSCNPDNDTRTITVTASDDVGLASVVLRWTHTATGAAERSMVRASGSTWSATLGPFTEVGTVTVRVRATDTAGEQVTSGPITVAVEPCPG